MDRFGLASLLRIDVCGGDSSKLRQATGWRPTVDFPTMLLRLLKDAQNA